MSMTRMSLTCPHWFFLSLVLLVFGAAEFTPVLAGPLTVTLLSEGAGADVNIAFLGGTSGSPNVYKMSGFVGEMNMQLNSHGHVSDFIGFSVDVAHFVSVGQTYQVNAYSTNPPTNGLPNGAQVAYLANTFGANLSHIQNPVQRNIQAAALQIAIWSEIYNQDNGFTSGAFRFVLSGTNDPYYALDSAIAAAASTYLADARHQSAFSLWYDASPSGQGQRRGESMVLADPPPVAPEPPTMVLFALGLVCLGFAYQRKQGLGLA
jgi:hypothetical protein